MSKFSLSQRSRSRLDGVHPHLVKVVKRAITITKIDFAVLEGVRTKEKQYQLMDKGATTTLRSRHLTGHAVDLGAIMDGELRWDWPLYFEIADAMKAAAVQCGVPIEWGGDWKSFKDGPHFQLPWSLYPAEPKE